MNLERFIQICEGIVPDERGCRVWPMGKTLAGYPQLNLDGRNVYGHRLSLEVKLGRALLPRLRALHSCDNPSCVAHEHLREGTQKQNCEDARLRGRNNAGDKNGSRTCPERRPVGVRNGHALLTEEQVREIFDLALREEMSQREIGKKYGVVQQAVSDIKNGRNWTHVTGLKRPR